MPRKDSCLLAGIYNAWMRELMIFANKLKPLFGRGMELIHAAKLINNIFAIGFNFIIPSFQFLLIIAFIGSYFDACAPPSPPSGFK